jgi:hypothetical protein
VYGVYPYILTPVICVIFLQSAMQHTIFRLCCCWFLTTALQSFVAKAFQDTTSTDQALSLLAQFDAILQRAALKQELESKYTASCAACLHCRREASSAMHESQRPTMCAPPSLSWRCH